MTTSEQDYRERRISPRHQIKDSSAVVLSPPSIISFSLIDISKTGMAFSYDGKETPDTRQDSALVDCFFEDIGGTLEVPVKIISDTEIDRRNLWLSSHDTHLTMPYLRRCGIEFKDLSDQQKDIIFGYIKSLEMQ